MKIVRYEKGEMASHDVDCIKIERVGEDSWSLTGSALDGETSVSFLGPPNYETREAAEAAGIAWASGHGVQELHLETIIGR